MLNTLLVTVLALYSLYSVVKFAFFFLISYKQRRNALDRAYRGRACATRKSDIGLLLFAVLLAVAVELRGSEPVSFLAGLLIGMTLIQLYFHRFSEPLAARHSPPEPHSPIKWISYAIQAAPVRPWKEMLVITILLLWSWRQIVMNS